MYRTVYKKMGSLPSTAHNRMWASDATYAKVNGGNYNFIVEPIMAIPDDQVGTLPAVFPLVAVGGDVAVAAVAGGNGGGSDVGDVLLLSADV